MNGFATHYDRTPVIYAPAGVYTIAASFTNHSASSVHELYYRATTVGGNNLLLNAQGGPVGMGGVVTLPGEITPGATFTVDFVIGLQQQYPFDFYVDAFGLTDDIDAAIQERLHQLTFNFSIKDEALRSNEGESAAETQVYYLPFISR